MSFSSFIIPFYLLVFLISYGQPKRIADEIYISFDRARSCVRHLNATHEIGCQSAINGNSGRMYMIDSDSELTAYLTDTKTIDSSRSFIIALNVKLFNTANVDRLMSGLHSKLNGLLIYLKPDESRPTSFSQDDQCPNHRQSFYLNQTQPTQWNPHGTGLFFRSFPFPIMLIDEHDDYQLLIKSYKKCNSSRTSAGCGLELQTFQNAAHTSKTCMRRNDITHLLLDATDTFCDPIGGLNIYSKLPQSLTIKPNPRHNRSVVLILAATDSFQMFLKAPGTTGGAQQPATALLTFLALAHLVGQEQELFNAAGKEVIFLTLDGDALDYSASFRFMSDMIKGNFPDGDRNEERIRIEHIHSVIEFQSLSFNKTDNLSLYTYPPSLINQTFIDTLINYTQMINQIPSGSSLPPASSQIFLRQAPPASFPAYILTSTENNQLSNHYYHSFFDDPSTLGINLTTLEYNTTTEFSRWLKRLVEPIAQTLLDSYVGREITVTIEQEIINNLVYCVLKNIDCPLIHNVTNQSTGDSFNDFNQTAFPFSINTYPETSTPGFPFVKSVLSYFLRDRTFDARNVTETECEQYAKNDTLTSYTFVSGYSPSIVSGKSFASYCVRSYLRFVTSKSPAFDDPNYDLSDTTFPAWTESRWSTFSLRLFVIPTRAHEILTLLLGIFLLSLSFTVFFILRCCTTFSLVQPSSS